MKTAPEQKLSEFRADCVLHGQLQFKKEIRAELEERVAQVGNKVLEILDAADVSNLLNRLRAAATVTDGEGKPVPPKVSDFAEMLNETLKLDKLKDICPRWSRGTAGMWTTATSWWRA